MNHTGVNTTPLRRARWDLLAIGGCLALAAWVQAPALGAFFSSPDDLVHLQQASGLKPVLPSPFRFLSQVVYFRAMVWSFGPVPLPFHLVSLLVHLANVALLFVLVRGVEGSRLVAAICASLFGAFPLFFPLLASAVGMNDELALAFTLVSMLLLKRDSGGATLAAWASFVAALLCKESVLAMPLVALAAAAPSRRQIARTLPLIGISLIFGGLLFVLPPQGLGPYAIRLGTNLFHNLMTYTTWAVNVVRPLPDLISSFDPSAWRAGIWVYVLVLASFAGLRGERRLLGGGLVWWLVALLPVLPLRFQTYRHYLYLAIPGLALVFAVLLSRGVSSALRVRNGPERGPRSGGRLQQVAVGVLALGVLAYGVQAQRLIRARQAARVPGTDMALDPFVRRQEVARNALASFAQFLGPGDSIKVAIFAPAGTRRVFGARSGREYTGAVTGRRPYDLLRESLDHGGGVRLFFPQVDSVAFIDHWTPAYDGHQLYLSYGLGNLLGVGSGVPAHEQTARWMLEQKWYAQARDYLATVLTVHPSAHTLRLAYGSVLFKMGDPAGARDQLLEIVRADPEGDAAAAARVLLAAPVMK